MHVQKRSYLLCLPVRNVKTHAKIDNNVVDGLSTNFKNVKLVTPKIFTNYCFNDLKLKFVEEKAATSEPGIELLRNISANYDYWIVRNHQVLLLYYRLQILMQRVEFLKSVGLDEKQKLRNIQKYPPVLLFSFTDNSYDAKMVYLRGLVRKNETEFIHLFHPVTRKVRILVCHFNVTSLCIFTWQNRNLKLFSCTNEELTCLHHSL